MVSAYATAANPAIEGDAYKETEIGLLPSDWTVEPIEEFALITTGGRNTQDRVDDGAYPFFVRSQKIERINTYSFDGEAVLTAGDGVGTGKIFHYIKGKCDIHQRVYRISDFRDDVSGYYFYLFFSSNFYNRIMQMTAKSSVDSVRREMIARMLIALPPKPEQEAIAEALSDADALIESLEALIAKKRAIKQGVMQDLLSGRKRLPGFSGERKEWILYDLAEGKKALFDDGDWIEAEHLAERGVRFIQTGNIGVGEFLDRAERKYVREDSVKSLRCKFIEPGDLLICRLADPAGRACVMPDINEERIVTSVDVTIFRPPSHLANRQYLEQVFSTDAWLQLVSERSGGTTHRRIARGTLGKLVVMLPCVEEQAAIGTILSEMDESMRSIKEKLTKARQLKQGMMQELLTGRVRLV